VADLPALDLLQLNYLPLAVAAIRLGQSHYRQAKGIIIVLNRIVVQR